MVPGVVDAGNGEKLLAPATVVVFVPPHEVGFIAVWADTWPTTNWMRIQTLTQADSLANFLCSKNNMIEKFEQQKLQNNVTTKLPLCY